MSVSAVILREWSLITGRGGGAKLHHYKKGGGGAGNVLAILKGGHN